MRSKPLFFGTLTGIALVVLLLSAVSIRTLFTPDTAPQSAAYTRGQAGLESGVPGSAPRTVEGMELVVGEVVEPSISRPVSEMPAFVPGPVELNRELNPRMNQTSFLEGNVTLEEEGPDPLVQNGVGGAPVANLGGVNFDGIIYETGGSGFPPDPTGDVGPNHYFQSVNTTFQIFNKDGSPASAIVDNNILWQGAGGSCEAYNNGDPIVLYDEMADRWLFTQFVAEQGEWALCAAVSTSPDPVGTYYRYEFDVPSGLPDYPKYGIWPDAYYVGTNEATYSAYAFNRAAMLAGQPSGFIKFTGQTNLMLPADFDGSTAPPAGSPGIFYTFKDNNFHGGGADRLEIFEFRPNFGTPANSTFAKVTDIPIASFTYSVCGHFNFECVPQPGTPFRVDALSEWPMARFVYRNMGTYQTLIGNFAVDVGSDRSGIRWFELRKPGSAWALHQEGTYAPGSEHRWVGSMAMDRRGNIGLGYSVSSSSVYPSLGFTTRLASDPAGQLRAESILHPGTASQSFNDVQRWGDYSALAIDPSDDCTFWYTGEYYDTTSPYWKTRIGTFTIPGCADTQSGGKLILNILLRRTGGGNPTATPTTPPGPTVTPSPTQPSGGTIANGNFEQGNGVAWTEASESGTYPHDIVTNSGNYPPYQGSYYAWLGRVNNEVTQIYQQITVPTNATLHWRHRIVSTESCGFFYDKGYMAVSTDGSTYTALEEYDLCSGNTTGGYVQGSTSLAAYSGQQVYIIFGAQTDGSILSDYLVDNVGYSPSAAEGLPTDLLPLQPTSNGQIFTRSEE
jgi:hypothetical protein